MKPREPCQSCPLYDREGIVVPTVEQVLNLHAYGGHLQVPGDLMRSDPQCDFPWNLEAITHAVHNAHQRRTHTQAVKEQGGRRAALLGWETRLKRRLKHET